MTKAEIIRKLAKKVGVQDLDAKIFFEVFLRKISLQLNPGETIKVKNFGYFQMRTGKIKKTTVSNSDTILADLIVFYPILNEQNEANENFIFNIPYKKEEEYNLIDSYFSLSFGKPVIPLKDANISEYFIPPTGNELRRLFDTKADKLLQEVEVVENYVKGNEVLLIDPEFINANQIEINWEEININSDSPEKNKRNTEQSSLKESDAFSWEFGEDLEKQIKEEALLDTENEDSLFVEYDDLKEISWDFGENVDGKEEPPSLTEGKEITIEREFPVQDEKEKKLDKFQRVKSVTSEFNIDHKTPGLTGLENIESWGFGDHDSAEDSDLLKSINEELNEEGFAEVKHKPRMYRFETDIYERLGDDIGIPETQDEKNESDSDENIISETGVEENPFPGIQEELSEKLHSDDQMHDIEDTDIFKTPQELLRRPERNLGYSKRKGIGLYVILVFFFLIGGAVFVYLKFLHMNYSGNKKVVSTKISGNNSPAVIIKRDFDIPVTYPYTNDSNVIPAIDPIDKSVFDQYENKKSDDSISTNLKDQNNANVLVKQPPETKVNNVKPSVVKQREFIYKSGDKYIVQISSWSSEHNALKHASYFKGKGFQTEIVKANLDRGTWYRVRVGYFNSENEAEKFYNTYK